MARTSTTVSITVNGKRVTGTPEALALIFGSPRVSEPKVRIEAVDNGYKARRSRGEGGTCARCAQTFAYENGLKWHNANRPDCKA